MAVKYQDSVQKILSYLDGVAQDKEVVVSNMLFRDFTCPANCGGCCPKFSLDFFEGERWEKFKELYPEQIERFEKREVNGATVYTDWQKDNDSRWCRNLNLENGRCGIHKSNPFTCEFELLKVKQVHRKSGNNKTYVTKQLFGRGWSYKRVDGGVGALCEMIGMDINKTKRDLEMFEELQDISFKMNIKTQLNSVINLIKNKIQQTLWT